MATIGKGHHYGISEEPCIEKEVILKENMLGNKNALRWLLDYNDNDWCGFVRNQ